MSNSAASVWPLSLANSARLPYTRTGVVGHVHAPQQQQLNSSQQQADNMGFPGMQEQLPCQADMASAQLLPSGVCHIAISGKSQHAILHALMKGHQAHRSWSEARGARFCSSAASSSSFGASKCPGLKRACTALRMTSRNQLSHYSHGVAICHNDSCHVCQLP